MKGASTHMNYVTIGTDDLRRAKRRLDFSEEKEG